MSTPYENEVSFSWPGLSLAETANSTRMKEILDFIGESEETFQARLKQWREVAARGKERFYAYSHNEPERIILDFEHIFPCHFMGFGQRQEWMQKNWGCNSNAESVVWYPKQRTLAFETYQGAALPVFAALHRKFPDVTIHYEWRGPGDGLKGGCEFLALADWDEGDISARDTWLIERGLKEKGETPKLTWEAGKPYNEWCVDYCH